MSFTNKHESIDQHAVQKAIFEINLRHLNYFVLGIIPLTLFHVILFALKQREQGSPEAIWQSGILFLHAGMLLISVVVGLLALSHKIRQKPGKKTMKVIMIVLLAIVNLFAIAIVVFDQIVTTSITPYIIICVVTAFIARIGPRTSVTLYLISFLIYFFGIAITQTDPAALLSNRVNGITAIMLGMVLSFMFWRGTLRDIMNEIIIKKQRRDLENRNKELLEQSEKLAIAIAARDKFFSIIGHDLKSPFNSLMGFTEILLDDWDEIDDNEKRQIIRLMKETSESTYQLLLNLLDWARIQKEQMQVRSSVINVRELTDSVLTQLNAQATLKGITAVINIEADLRANADERMLNAIIRNLISNAIKFSVRQSPITISASLRTDELLFCVKDQGVGMAKEDVSRILGTNQVQSTEGTDNEKGTGLGLQLCKEFVRMHHGKIWADTEPGLGATFCFTIPQN